MSGDGFSVKTTITQIGNVARAQLKGQQSANPDAPATTSMLKNEKRTDRVKKPPETQKEHLDPEKRRRGGGEDGAPQDGHEPGREDEPAEPGSVIDTTA